MGKGVKNLLGYLMILVIHLMSYVSLSAAQRVGRGIGWLMWIRRTRGREVARVNLSLCYPDQTDAERSDMIHETLLQSGMTGAEMGPMWGYSTSNSFPAGAHFTVTGSGRRCAFRFCVARA